jgi:hypothetical protein
MVADADSRMHEKRPRARIGLTLGYWITPAGASANRFFVLVPTGEVSPTALADAKMAEVRTKRLPFLRCSTHLVEDT